MDSILEFLQSYRFAIGIVVMIMGVLYTIWTVKHNDMLIKREGIETKARVSCYRFGDSFYEMVYRFYTINGKEVYGIASIRDREWMESHYPVGSVIGVIYAPSSPRSTCRLSENFMNKMDLEYRNTKNNAVRLF